MEGGEGRASDRGLTSFWLLGGSVLVSWCDFFVQWYCCVFVCSSLRAARGTWRLEARAVI